MSFNSPREGASNSGSSELPGSSDDGQSASALRKMIKEEVELTVPMIGSLIREVVKEEIQSALLTHGNGNHTHEATMSTESRTLQLKFLDEVSLPVLTGKEIKGQGGTAMRLAIVDNTTGQLVTSGPEASGKVEILLLLQADDDDDKHNWSTEDFNNKIIGESDKEKPCVAKGTYVHLKAGVGILSDVKLGHGSSWKKRCLCRLGARSVDNPNGNRVKEAWIESFMVEDRLGKLYGKHHPPSLSDEVWRLKNISRDGERCKRLSKEYVKTVQDFLFAHSVDPQKLESVFRGPKEWKATLEHARTCRIDYKKIYLYNSLSKFNFAVAFDVVPQLMGIVRHSHYVRLDNLCEVEQDKARELFLLALSENQEDIMFVDDETSLVQQFPYERMQHICYPPLPVPDQRPISLFPPGSNEDLFDPPVDLALYESCTGSVCQDPSSSSSTIGPPMCPSNNFSLIVSGRMQQICDPTLPVPDQRPSSSLIAFGYNEALCDPSFTVPDQSPSNSLSVLGSFRDQGLSSSLIALDSQHALRDPSLTVPEQASMDRLIELRFSKKISRPTLACHEIQGEGKTCIEVVLIDSSTGNKVEVGVVAFAIVELVVLEQGTDDCAGEGFNEKIVRVEGNSLPLLTVDACKLQGGSCILEDVKFRHHATQVMKPTVFRLGARIVGTFDGIIVKEAKTESFAVKCYRKKYSMKKEIPNLMDKIWVLKNIQRHGKIEERLQAEGIDTVEKFLIHLLKNPQELKKIARSKGKTWDSTVNHARKCQSNKIYWYFNSQENSGVVFDIFGELQGMYSEGEYAATDRLSKTRRLMQTRCYHLLSSTGEMSPLSMIRILFNSTSTM